MITAKQQPNKMIRPYEKEDKDKIVGLLRLNTPDYFAPDEEYDFVEYLDKYREDYFVVEENGEIIGAGGINYMDKGTTAVIAWDMFHPKEQGKGLGTRLTLFRIDVIKQRDLANVIYVRTSQKTYKFYEKCGFELKEVVPDYWAKGYDLYRMEMKIK